MTEANNKVQAQHLKRNAYLYVRQSTLRQVFENTESTKRQYDLRQRAIALGWRLDQVIVIDSDLGHSGASAVDRVSLAGEVLQLRFVRGPNLEILAAVPRRGVDESGSGVVADVLAL